MRRVEAMPGHVTPNDIWLKDVRYVLKEVYSHYKSTFTSFEFFKCKPGKLVYYMSSVQI